jgi:DNA-binding MarR family transcriptional regulator
MDSLELQGSPSGRTARGYNSCVSNYSSAPPKRPDLLSGVELGAWRGLLRAHAALTRELDAELQEAHGLPLSSYEVLLFLSDAPAGRLRMSELADGVLLSRSGLTRLVDRLERGGLVRREQCPSDARGYWAVITDEGRRAFAQARATHLDGVRRRFLDRLSKDEQRHLGNLLDRLLDGP